jgi:hypothetical protein
MRTPITAVAMCASIGCTHPDSSGSADGGDDAVLRGVYSVDGPSIRGLNFPDDQHYVLWRGDCPPSSRLVECVETGTFRREPGSIVLTDAESGVSTTLPLKVLATVPAAPAGTVTPADDGNLVQHGGSLTNDTSLLPRVSSGLIGEPPAPLELVVAKADCDLDLPINKDPAAVLKDFQQRIAAEGGSIVGTPGGGTFHAKGASGTYSVRNGVLHVEIPSLPFYWPSCQKVGAKLGQETA